MDDWEKFSETSLPEKEKFYGSLNIEDITEVDYKNKKRVCKDFEIKNLRDCLDLHLKSDTLLDKSWKKLLGYDRELIVI